jgi:hypothetical protein
MDGSAGDTTDRSCGDAAAMVDEPVARVQHAAPAPLQHPAFPRDLRGVRLPVYGTVELEGRIPAEDEAVNRTPIDVPAHYRFGFRSREKLNQLARRHRSSSFRDGFLVHS